MRRLASIDPEQPARFEDLVALNAARNCIDELFKACSDELRSDPETTDLWEAMASVVTMNSKHRTGMHGAAKQSPQGTTSTSDQRVEMFWNTFAGRFTWDFLPVDFLHALYTQWLSEQFPHEPALPQGALTRRLKSAAAKSGDWYHTRARPGSLMKTTEPLAARVPQWSHDGSNATIYGMRRSGI